MSEITRVTDPDGYSHDGFLAIPFTQTEAGQNTLGAWTSEQPTRFTVQTGGIYWFDLHCIAIVAANTPVALFVFKNGQPLYQINRTLVYLPSVAGAESFQLHFSQFLSAGDFIEWRLSTSVPVTIYPRAGVVKL